MERGNDERGRGVFCKNCPFPSRALSNPEKTFVRGWPSVPVVVRQLPATFRDPERMEGEGDARSSRRQGRGTAVAWA